MEQDRQSSKRLVRSLFKRRGLPTIPFLPFISLFTAKLAQVSPRALISDPTPFTNSLRDCYKLLGYHAVSLPVDTSLEAEACGCTVEWPAEQKYPTVTSLPLADKSVEEIAAFDVSNFENKGRIPVLLETIKRLNITIGKEVALVGTVTGPLTLAAHMAGDQMIGGLREVSEQSEELLKIASSISIKLSKIYCEHKVDVIVIVDELTSRLEPADIGKLLPNYRPLLNVIRFYRVNPVLLVKGFSPLQIEKVLKLGPDGVIVDTEISTGDLSELASRNNCCFSKAIPEEAFLGSPENAAEQVKSILLEGRDKKGFFLSTGWEIPYHAPVECLHEIMRVVKG